MDTKNTLADFYKTIQPEDYDKRNHLLTFHQDSSWRMSAAKSILKDKPQKILDLCCGTGELTLAIADLCKNTECEITGLDFSAHFLELAQKKAQKRNFKIKWIEGDAASLLFPNEYFDAIGISFALRNLLYKNEKSTLCLEEIKRVLKRGGRLVILETSQPKNAVVKFLFHLYLKIFVAPLGGSISNNLNAYKYLAESSEKFLSSKEIVELLINTGFNKAEVKHFMFGAVSLYSFVKN